MHPRRPKLALDAEQQHRLGTVQSCRLDQEADMGDADTDAKKQALFECVRQGAVRVMTGDCAVRKAEDVGGQELSYAEVKAIASVNTAVPTPAEAEAELQRLDVLRKNHQDEQYLARRSVRELPDRIAFFSRRIELLGEDVSTLAADDQIAVGNRPLPATRWGRSVSE